MRRPILADFIATYRGGIVENRHAVHAAVVDATGKLLYTVGDSSRMTLARSAAKPAQALAIIETGAFDQFDFDQPDLALMCASNSSEERHIARARQMLSKAGVSESDLRCGGHTPLSDAVNSAWIKSDFTPTAVCSNCSGKHAGMLAGAKALGADTKDYYKPDHPLQVHVRQVVDEVTGVGPDEAAWGLDGCNLPAPAFPLHYLARMYAKFADAGNEERHTAADCDPSERMDSMARIFNAMTTYPELVAGEGRFCTVLMGAFEGTLFGKLGADGCYGIGIRECGQTKQLGAHGAIGIAVKIEDGNVSILYSAVMEILDQLQIGNEFMRGALDKFHRPEIINTVGAVTGQVSPEFKIRAIHS
jgi:L-asparaginase II